MSRHDFKVINSRRKESKSIMYMSSVFGKSKLQPDKMMETSRPFRTETD